MRRKSGILLLGFAAVFLGSSCEKNPINRLTNPLPGGVVPQSSGVFTLYDDELKTGGGLALIPSGENQTIDLSDRTAPLRTASQMRYSWNGGDVGGQHLFAGFLLVVTPDASTLDSAAGKNLSAPGYAKVIFYLRGSLASGNTLRIEGPDDGSGGITPARTELDGSLVTDDWRLVTLVVPAGDFTNVKIFLTVSLQFAQPPRTTAAGEGGTIYLDDIRYER